MAEIYSPSDKRLDSIRINHDKVTYSQEKMNQIPATENPVLIRTDFSNQAGWDAICTIVSEGFNEVPNFIEFIEDQDYDGIDSTQFLSLIPSEHEHTILALADGASMFQPDYALLVIDLDEEPGREFRTIASELLAIASNLSIANMDFEEFADAVEEDGVFRGF